MCELLTMSCRYPARLTSSLTALASHAKGDSRNRDGWGLAFYQGRDVALYRDTRRLSENKAFERVAPNWARKNLIIPEAKFKTDQKLLNFDVKTRS